MESLELYIKNIIPDSKEVDLKRFVELFETRELKKNDFLWEQGQYSRYEGFVLEGCFRLFHFDRQGNDHTLYFAIKNWWVTDIDSFMNKKPSLYGIQALMDSKVLLVNRENKEKAFKEIPFTEKLFRLMAQKSLIVHQQRILRYNSISAEERYFHFLDEYSNISQLVSNKQIASYLGVTPEFISRIKKKKG